ncbi:hypothetical protein M422DRAFT_238328 [Sphaerobolus stellatus SS14]|nr:hypothetical protein M422DRAFT_238328 [Sphaerobolus stellatus SS14]
MMIFYLPLTVLLPLIVYASGAAGLVTTSNTEVSIVAPDNSIAANFLAFGATVKNLWVPGKDGKWRDLVLGFDTVSEYTNQTFGRQFFGPIVGRYANRIKNATFSIPPSANPPPSGPGVFHVPANEHNGLNSLHGGSFGYDLRVWNVTAQTKNSVSFSLLDPNGTEGFPGNQRTEVTYTLEPNGKWKIFMHATVDQLSPILLSSHVYWNFDGYQKAATLDNHFTQFQASRYIATDGILIPNGKIAPTKGTPLDFSKAKSLGAAINQTDGLNLCGTGCIGFDNCWLYDKPQNKEPIFSVWSTTSGIKLDVTTDQIGLQIYTCDGINNGTLAIPRKKTQGGPNAFYENHSCLVIEQESAIDAINNPSWGIDQIFGPNKAYSWNSEYAFSIVH